MLGYSPKLPLMYDKSDGPYLLTKNVNEMAKQNLKMLLLTNPGERIAIPDFGIGLKKYLFENDTVILRENLQTEIISKVTTYLPYINILDIDITINPESTENNTLYLYIKFSIVNLPNIDELNIIV